MESEFKCYYMSAIIFQPNIFLVVKNALFLPLIYAT